MKATFNIDDALMEQLRMEAARREITVTEIVESGIRHMIVNGYDKQQTANELRPLPSRHGGGFLVDISNREELYRIFDEEKPSWS